MTTAEYVASSIAILSLIVASVTAYRSFFARFAGQGWTATRLVLTHVDTIPSLGVACYFENAGAKPGLLDDARLLLKHNQSGTSLYFYPHIMRNDYSIFATYRAEDWFPFSGIPLTAKQRAERYILFKPLNDKFSAQAGDYSVLFEVRWHRATKWTNRTPALKFSLTPEASSNWNDPACPAWQVLSAELIDLRQQPD